MFLGAMVGLGVGSAVSHRRVRADSSGAYNVRDNGAFGDGVADDRAALQALIDSVPPRSCLYFPIGHYKLTSTLECGSKGLTFRGDAQGKPLNVYDGGSVLRGSFVGPLVRWSYPASGVTVTDIGLSNYHATGTALQVGGNLITLERLAISAYRGIWGPSSTFTVGISNVQLVCTPSGAPLGSVGILVSGHTAIRSADVVGYDHGIRACGLGVDIRSCRIEVNRVGMVLGMDSVGNNVNLTGAAVEAISFEANDIALHANLVAGGSIRGISIHGTPNSPSAGATKGMWVTSAKAIDFQGCIVGGSYSDASIRVSNQSGVQRWSGCIVGNQNSGASRWAVPSTPNFIYEQCDI